MACFSALDVNFGSLYIHIGLPVVLSFISCIDDNTLDNESLPLSFKRSAPYAASTLYQAVLSAIGKYGNSVIATDLFIKSFAHSVSDIFLSAAPLNHSDLAARFCI
jgi:hypothetical protein